MDPGTAPPSQVRIAVDPATLETALTVTTDEGMKSTIAKWAALKAEGLTNKDAAERLGLTKQDLDRKIKRAVKDGWLILDDPGDQIQYLIVPRVIDNVVKFLDLGSEKMTIEAAKGVGIFKQHQAVKLESDLPPQILAIKIEMPLDGSDSKNIVGTPRIIDIEPEQ